MAEVFSFVDFVFRGIYWFVRLGFGRFLGLGCGACLGLCVRNGRSGLLHDAWLGVV